MVHPAFFEEAQRAKSREGECTFHRFMRIVEIDQEGFATTGFNKAVGMSSLWATVWTRRWPITTITRAKM